MQTFWFKRALALKGPALQLSRCMLLLDCWTFRKKNQARRLLGLCHLGLDLGSLMHHAECNELRLMGGRGERACCHGGHAAGGTVLDGCSMCRPTYKLGWIWL